MRKYLFSPKKFEQLSSYYFKLQSSKAGLSAVLNELAVTTKRDKSSRCSLHNGYFFKQFSSESVDSKETSMTLPKRKSRSVNLTSTKSSIDKALLNEQSFHSELKELDKEIESLLIQPDFNILEALQVTESFKTKPKAKQTNLCPGCGATLQCVDMAKPGYISFKWFSQLNSDLRKFNLCFRCNLLQHHKLALDVKVSPDVFEQFASDVQTRSGGVVLLVGDVTDLPNSLHAKVLPLLRPDRKLYVIGNKIDLLPKDSKDFLKRVESTLLSSCKIIGICGEQKPSFHLISARTGYGIETLIDKLFADFKKFKGDIYLVGCTNVGKSSLFNVLLDSDLCKHAARDYQHAATVSHWPGTTIYSLRFPVLKPTTERLAQRRRRLRDQKAEEKLEQQERRNLLLSTKNRDFAAARGQVKRTFYSQNRRVVPKYELDESMDAFRMGSFNYNDSQSNVQEGRFTQRQLHDDSRQIELSDDVTRHGRWCLDTPGIVNPQQLINLLSQDELSLVVAHRPLQPRSAVLLPGHTLLLSALARIDLISVWPHCAKRSLQQSEKSVILSVFSASTLPLVVLPTEEVEAYYSNDAKVSKLKVPCGGRSELPRFPSLQAREFQVLGPESAASGEAVADVILSSLGWVSVLPRRGAGVTLRAFTPGAVGLTSRSPALLPRAAQHRGRRVGRLYNCSSDKSWMIQ